MPAHLLSTTGKAAGIADVGDAIASQAIKPHLIHEAVTAEMAWRRSGTHSTKTRSDVRGGGAKPWRQKGTGRARAGSNRSPIWTGGGVVFGPHPRSHGGKVNRKAHQQAFRSALKAHVERGSIAVMEPTGWDAPSTKRASSYLAAAPEELAPRPLLVVVTESAGVEALSFRNLDGVRVLEARDLETVDLMAGRSVLVERSVWDRWNGAAPAAADGEDAA